MKEWAKIGLLFLIRYIFWIIVTAVLLFTLMGVIVFVWPEVTGFIPELILEILVIVSVCWAGLLATIVVVSLVAGLRLTIGGIVEFWDNVKDGVIMTWLKPAK